jgi:flagellar biosynthesis/type III secretory pathway protein FliH
MARVIRAAALARAPRVLYPELVPAPAPVPEPSHSESAPPEHVCAAPARVAELEQEVATLETQLAELLLRMETWRVEESTRAGQAYREAVERGLAEGRDQAVAEGRAARQQLAEQGRRVLESLRRQVTERAGECEDALVGIAFAAVCKLLGEQAAGVEGLRALVRQACADLGEHEELRVRLHPADLTLLRLAPDGVPDGVVVVPDAAVALGGCMVDSNAGTLDARLEIQMAELAAVLTAVRATRRAAGSAQS